MTYNAQRYETLMRLGIEQMPLLTNLRSSSRYDIDEHEARFESLDIPIKSAPVPGRRCPACLSKGQTIWVIPGKRCPQCGTEVN